MADLSAMGFLNRSASSTDALLRRIQCQLIRVPDTEQEGSQVFEDASGAQIWIRSNTLSPHFNSDSSCPLEVTVCRAPPDSTSAGHLEFHWLGQQFTAIAPGFRHNERFHALPAKMQINITAVAHKSVIISPVIQRVSYYAMSTGYPNVIGRTRPMPSVGTAHIGVVVKSARWVTNVLTNRRFAHIQASEFGGTIDVVGDLHTFPSLPPDGSLIWTQARLSGRILKQ